MSAFLRTLCILSLMETPLLAKNFGVHGHVFPIAEEHFLNHIKKQLTFFSSTDGLKTLEKRIVETYLPKIEQPSFINHLKNATEYRFFFYDPSIVVSNDIADHAGNIIVKKGFSFNPLDISSLKENLLFIDGSNPLHLDWAQNEKKAKWILVKGKPLELEKHIKHKIFFDQFGFLINKLDIKKLPAKVSQEGSLLKIEEIPLEEP